MTKLNHHRITMDVHGRDVVHGLVQDKTEYIGSSSNKCDFTEQQTKM